MLHMCVVSCFSCVQLSVTLWTIDRQAPLSKGFPRHEYWSGLPCPPLGDLHDLRIGPSLLQWQESSLVLAPPGPSHMSVACYGILFVYST